MLVCHHHRDNTRSYALAQNGERMPEGPDWTHSRHGCASLLLWLLLSHQNIAPSPANRHTHTHTQKATGNFYTGHIPCRVYVCSFFSSRLFCLVCTPKKKSEARTPIRPPQRCVNRIDLNRSGAWVAAAWAI